MGGSSSKKRSHGQHHSIYQHWNKNGAKQYSQPRRSELFPHRPDKTRRYDPNKRQKDTARYSPHLDAYSSHREAYSSPRPNPRAQPNRVMFYQIPQEQLPITAQRPVRTTVKAPYEIIPEITNSTSNIPSHSLYNRRFIPGCNHNRDSWRRTQSHDNILDISYQPMRMATRFHPSYSHGSIGQLDSVVAPLPLYSQGPSFMSASHPVLCSRCNRDLENDSDSGHDSCHSLCHSKRSRGEWRSRHSIRTQERGSNYDLDTVAFRNQHTMRYIQNQNPGQGLGSYDQLERLAPHRTDRSRSNADSGLPPSKNSDNSQRRIYEKNRNYRGNMPQRRPHFSDPNILSDDDVPRSYSWRQQEQNQARQSGIHLHHHQHHYYNHYDFQNNTSIDNSSVIHIKSKASQIGHHNVMYYKDDHDDDGDTRSLSDFQV